MISVRGCVLDTVALIGIGVGVTTSVLGYTAGPPDRITRSTVAEADIADPTTTGAIKQKGTVAGADRKGTEAGAKEPPTEPQRADGQRVWTDPPRR